MMVFFTPDPINSIWSSSRAKEKKATFWPVGLTRTPPRPHFQVNDVGSKQASVYMNHTVSEFKCSFRGSACSRKIANLCIASTVLLQSFVVLGVKEWFGDLPHAQLPKPSKQLAIHELHSSPEPLSFH